MTRDMQGESSGEGRIGVKNWSSDTTGAEKGPPTKRISVVVELRIPSFFRWMLAHRYRNWLQVRVRGIIPCRVEYSARTRMTSIGTVVRLADCSVVRFHVSMIWGITKGTLTEECGSMPPSEALLGHKLYDLHKSAPECYIMITNKG